MKNIERIFMGNWKVKAWYFSPYLEEYAEEEWFVFDFCLEYIRKKRAFVRHNEGMMASPPPPEGRYTARII